MAADQQSKAVSAGRGVLLLTFSKAYFIIAGYAIYFGLPRVIGTELFGRYALVTGIVSVLNAVLITGTIQAVSKFVSEEPSRAGAVKRTAVRLQICVGGSLFIAYLLLAPVIARFLNDPDLTVYLRLSSLIVIAYAFYAIYTGYINGLKRFGMQAGLDITFSTLKLALVVGLAAAGLGVAGAVGGFGAAAVVILLIASIVVGRVSAQDGIGMGKLFRFEYLIMILTLVINLLLQTDLFLLKALSPAENSYTLAAYYAAAQKLSFIPYQAIISITFVIFPLISRLTYIMDHDRAREYISQALRYSLIITVLIAMLFSSNAEGTMRLLFPAGYEAGGAALTILIFGIVCFALLFVSSSVISGSGRPLHSLLIVAGTWLLDAGLNYSLIPGFGMQGAAVATTTAMASGLAAAWLYLWRRFGACLPLLSILRVGLCAAALYWYSVCFPAAGMMLLVKFGFLAVAYVVLLVLVKEIGTGDLARVKAIRGRRNGE